MKNCTPLWREARLEVKMYKTRQLRATFGSCSVEKVHAVVARRTCPSQNAQSTPCSDQFWKLTCWKKCTPLWREAHVQVKICKHIMRGPLLEVDMSKKTRRCGAKYISKSKVLKTDGLGPFLDVQMPFGVAGARDSVHCQQSKALMFL